MRQGGHLKAIVGIGAGGHARALLEIVLLRGEFEVVGLLDEDASRHDRELSGVPILGGDELLPQLFSDGIRTAFLGVGGVGDNRPRARVFERVRSIGFRFADVIHPTAIVAKSVVMGDGVVLMAGVIVNSGARLGENVIINTGAVVDHDAIIGDHVHIASGAVLSGGVEVGSYSHVGTGASIRQNVRIGQEAVVGVGAAVIGDVGQGETVAGVPARVLELRSSVPHLSKRSDQAD
jgi:UDP-perosamine 4-acetyltransferase